MASSTLSKTALKNLLPFLLLIVGVILIYGSIKNQSPIAVIKSVISGGSPTPGPKKNKGGPDARLLPGVGAITPNSFTPGPNTGTGGTVQAI
jgi:hypothetical protein